MDARDPMVNKVSNHLQPWHRLEGKVVMVTGTSSASAATSVSTSPKPAPTSSPLLVGPIASTLSATKSTTLHLP
ncbi:hypothetical protein AAG906_003390 [Vitis piasezkii]